MRLIRLFALLALSLPAWGQQQIINLGTNPNDHTGTTLRAGGAEINANFTQLYNFMAPFTATQPGSQVLISPTIGGIPAFRTLVDADLPSDLIKRFNGIIYVGPSGDTTGVTDLADLQSAFTTLAQSYRLPPLASAYYATAKIILGPGTFYFTSGLGNLLAANTLKLEGISIECSGRNVTDLDYNPTVSGPFLVNNHGINVKFSDCSFVGHDANSSFFWSQEQAGLTNVQDYTWVDNAWQGSWNNVFRLTGANNNSEWKFDRDTVAGTVANWVYVPPRVATTISSSSSVIAATNTAEQVEIGDTGFFSSACAPLSANTQYYVVAATTSNFQVSTSAGGTPTIFSANCTPSFQTGNDQFLNFWFDKAKFNTGSANANWLNLAYGGSVKIHDSDASGHAPAAAGSCLFILGTSANNGVHNSGVENFEVDGLRVEHSSNYSCTIISNWWRGSIHFNNLDESSQAGSRTISNVYATYNFTQNGGPTVRYTNSQLMGTHAYTVQSNDYAYQSEVSYDTVTLYDNPTFANFIVMSGTNTGGYPIINCDHCRNNGVSTTTGYQEIVDTSLNWQYSSGKGQLRTRTVPCLGAQSNWPINGTNIQFRLPLNAVVTQFRYNKPGGTTNSGGYQYVLQTTDATPVVLAGGAGTPMAGSNAGTALPWTSTYVTTPNLPLSTDTTRTLQLIDTLPRSGTFTGITCLIDYIGSLWTPYSANDDRYIAAA